MVTSMSLCGRGKEFVEKIFWVRHVDWTKYNIKRAGVIPYTVINGHVHFCLGVDFKTKELTDFGGGIRDSDESPLHGALREFREESNGVFGEENYDSDKYMDSPCLIKNITQKSNYHMMIVFQEVEPCYLSSTMAKFQMSTNEEICAIFWGGEPIFRQLVYTPDATRMYTKVKKFIANCISFNRLVYFLKLRSQLAKSDPYFSSSLIINTRSEDGHCFDEPVCSFKRKRSDVRRPQLNIRGTVLPTTIEGEESLFRN